ncbi:hypothetical protein BDC45DRAFT_533044 [Circinella umbellata]|nr:hypothetical protein BDC45DRAFT_533044 [Circinella umbellata]
MKEAMYIKTLDCMCSGKNIKIIINSIIMNNDKYVFSKRELKEKRTKEKKLKDFSSFQAADFFQLGTGFFSTWRVMYFLFGAWFFSTWRLKFLVWRQAFYDLASLYY